MNKIGFTNFRKFTNFPTIDLGGLFLLSKILAVPKSIIFILNKSSPVVFDFSVVLHASRTNFVKLKTLNYIIFHHLTLIILT